MEEFISIERFIPNDLLQDTILDFSSKFGLFSEAEIVIMNYAEDDPQHKDLVELAKKELLEENDKWLKMLESRGADPTEEYPHLVKFENFCYITKDDIKDADEIFENDNEK